MRWQKADFATALKWAHGIEQDILRGEEPAFGEGPDDDIPFQPTAA